MTDTIPAAIGHNNAPLIDLDDLETKLDAAFSGLTAEAVGLKSLCDALPAEITEDAEAGRYSERIKDIQALASRFESSRKDLKAPVLAAGKRIDQYVEARADRLAILKASVSKPMQVWMDKKAAAERQRRAEEQARLQREADEKARLAAEMEKADMAGRAEQVMTAALQDAKKADRFAQSIETGKGLAAVRTETGVITTTRQTTEVKITDLARLDLEKLRPFFTQDVLQVVVNRAFKAGVTEIEGVTVSKRTELVTR